MHPRPRLKEALQVLTELALTNNDDAKEAVRIYESLKPTQEFLAGRMIIDIVDHFYHSLEIKGITYG